MTRVCGLVLLEGGLRLLGRALTFEIVRGELTGLLSASRKEIECGS